MIIYDGLAQNLLQRIGVFQIGSSLAGLYLYHTTMVVPGLESYYFDFFKHWGGLSWFTMINSTLLYTTYYAKYKVNRIYLH